MVDFQSRDTNRAQTAPHDESDEESDSHGHDDHGHDDHGHDGHETHSHDEHHEHHAHDVAELGTAIVTVSSSRSLDDDATGDAIAELITDSGHSIVDRSLVADDFDRIQQTVNHVATREDVNIVITTGGTGVTPDDVTIEAVEPLFEKHLPGFGELFRQLSFDEIGTRVVATRATAGVADGVAIFCLPGSENAVRLGVEDIILEEAGHLAGLAQRED